MTNESYELCLFDNKNNNTILAINIMFMANIYFC